MFNPLLLSCEQRQTTAPVSSMLPGGQAGKIGLGINPAQLLVDGGIKPTPIQLAPRKPIQFPSPEPSSQEVKPVSPVAIFRKTGPVQARLIPQKESHILQNGNGHYVLNSTSYDETNSPANNSQNGSSVPKYVDSISTKAKRENSYPARWQALYRPKVEFYIAKLTPLSCLPASTIRWIRNSSDERAAQEGMRYHEKSGQFVVDWVQKHCILYEGAMANTPLICEDWQYEYFMQLFGWMRHSEEVGRWIRRFTHAGVWIAKKNAKSPTLAATGLYTFVGDGEQGQHCYSIARDGKQAKIAHTHVMEMVRNSPILSRECKIKLTDYTVHHRKSKSTYTIVCADNSKSTEGFNGSLFVDETHVVDQEHMDRLKRAGISRTEPLHVEMSTAGNNSDGYGYNRYQYGVRVSRMDHDSDYNPHFLFIDYSVDQKITVEKLRDHDFIESISQSCNPAMGRIIRKEEFMADWHDSTMSDTELRKFGMYRLNLWLRDSAVWVELADWLRCSSSPLQEELIRDYCSDTYLENTMDHVQGQPVQYTLEDLKPYPCVAGLDMSQTRDMSALTLIFAVPDENLNVRPYTWTWHWLPEPTAISYRRWVDFQSPDYKNWIHLVKQRTIDYEHIATKLEWVRTNFDLRGLGYDVFNSVPLIRCLLNDFGWDENLIIKVPQQMRIMGPITKEVERWILRHEVHHPNNQVLNWQFQHAALDFDRAGNYKVIKPDKDDYRKVDGIVSLLIAGVILTLPEIGIWNRDSGSILLYERHAPEREGATSSVDTMSKAERSRFIQENVYS